MTIEEGKEEGVSIGKRPGAANYPPQPAIGTYQGVPNYPPQTGYPVYEASEHDPLPCCGCGKGWLLFILGFFLGIIPWYVGAILLLCDRNKDKREKPGYIACAIMKNDTFTTLVSKPAPTADVAVGPTLGPTHLTQQKKKKLNFFEIPRSSSSPAPFRSTKERERGRHHPHAPPPATPPAIQISGLPLHLRRPPPLPKSLLNRRPEPASNAQKNSTQGGSNAGNESVENLGLNLETLLGVMQIRKIR